MKFHLGKHLSSDVRRQFRLPLDVNITFSLLRGPVHYKMADTDEEYVQDISDDEVEAHQVTRGAGTGTRATGQGTRGGGWEVTRTWENVVEGADGTINSTVDGLLEAGKRKR